VKGRIERGITPKALRRAARWFVLPERAGGERAERTRSQWFSLWALGDLQALMIVGMPRGHRIASLYVASLAVAPENRWEEGKLQRLKGCGSALLTAAEQASRDLGFGGGLGLHAPSDAVGFFVNRGFTDRGPDPAEGGLHYLDRRPATSGLPSTI
jgi:hypothetical protein